MISSIPTSKQQIKYWLFTLSGALFLWIVAGNVLGNIFVYYGGGTRETCYPFEEIFYALNVVCENTLYDTLWEYTVLLPRLILSFAHISFGLFVKFFINWEPLLLVRSLYWLLVSPPVILLILLPGYRYWKQRNVFFARSCLALLACCFIFLWDIS